MAFKELLGLFKDNVIGRKQPLEKNVSEGAAFYRCDTCGYRRGFHLVYQTDPAKTVLICPACGQWFIIRHATDNKEY